MYVFGLGRCGWRGGEWMRGLSLGFTNTLGTGGVLDVCLCFGCGGVCGEWVRGLDQGREGWCPGICVLFLVDTCASEVHPVYNPVALNEYLFPNMYLFMEDITNPDSFVKCCGTLISLDITRCDSSTTCMLYRLEKDGDLQLYTHFISRGPCNSASRLWCWRKSAPKSGRRTSAITSLKL